MASVAAAAAAAAAAVSQEASAGRPVLQQFVCPASWQPEGKAALHNEPIIQQRDASISHKG